MTVGRCYSHRRHIGCLGDSWMVQEVYGGRGWWYGILLRVDLRETRDCSVHTSHRPHTHMLMHASYDVNAISRKGALPIWIGGSLFMALFSPVSHSLYKFECGPVHPLTSQHLNTADTNNHDPLDRRAGARS